MSPDTQLPVADERRTSLLVLHLASMVRRGAEVEEHHPFRAVVVTPDRQAFWPNAVMAAASIGGWLAASEPMFLLAGAVALLGMHQKLVADARRLRMLIRVDETGTISERALGAA